MTMVDTLGIALVAVLLTSCSALEARPAGINTVKNIVLVHGAIDVPPVSVAQGFGVFRHCNDLDGQLLCVLSGRQPAQ